VVRWTSSPDKSRTVWRQLIGLPVPALACTRGYNASSTRGYNAWGHATSTCRLLNHGLKIADRSHQRLELVVLRIVWIVWIVWMLRMLLLLRMLRVRMLPMLLLLLLLLLRILWCRYR
jgi:hypothetical protein